MASVMNTSQGTKGFFFYLFCLVFHWKWNKSNAVLLVLISQTFTLHFVLINYTVKKKLQCRERREGENEEFSFLLVEYS